MDFIHEEERDLKGLFSMFRNRKFEGTAGQAVKNSSFQFTQNIIMKFGGLFFTIVVARMLLPELFGLYSLALATVVLFASFSDLGIGSALFTYIAKLTGKKKNEEAKGYLKKLFKWKVYLLIITSALLLLSSYFIAEFYYAKPIFYALLVGALYIPIVGILSFIETIFKSTGNFKHPLVKEVSFQVLRFILVPLSIFLLLKTNFSEKILVGGILATIIICYLLTLILLIFLAKRKIKFLSSKGKKLTDFQVKDLKRFILPLTLTAISGVFFGYIDTIMLGHFVEEQFIAFYGTAFALVSSASTLIGFTSIALFPIFSRISGKQLEKVFRKTRNLTLIISVFSGIFTYFLAYYIIKIAYGSAYLTAAPLLKWFALLVLILPLTGLYDSYLVSQKKTRILAKLVIVTTVLNVLLNLAFITYGLRFGMFEAVLGACFATILSRGIYFFGVVWFRRKV